MSLMTIGTASSVVISTITLKLISSLLFSRFFNFLGGRGEKIVLIICASAFLATF